jgi:hypothetical protein
VINKLFLLFSVGLPLEVQFLFCIVSQLSKWQKSPLGTARGCETCVTCVFLEIYNDIKF